MVVFKKGDFAMTEWKVSHNYCGGEKFIQVYRIIDESQVDYTGNREFYPKIFETDEEAEKKAAELNAKEKDIVDPKTASEGEKQETSRRKAAEKRQKKKQKGMSR